MIYLDYAATAPMSEQAAKTYIDIQNSLYANPNSTHAFGRQASRKLEADRKSVV